jgi:hypothetical protein
MRPLFFDAAPRAQLSRVISQPQNSTLPRYSLFLSPLKPLEIDKKSELEDVVMNLKNLNEKALQVFSDLSDSVETMGERMEQRIEIRDQKIDVLDHKIENLAEKLNDKFNKINSLLEDLKKS